MQKKRVNRTASRSASDLQRDRKIRAKYQRVKPSLSALTRNSEFERPMKHGEYLTLMRFAARVKAAREKLRLSLTDLATRSGIDKSAISRLENGLVENPTIATLERIARSLGKRLKIELEDDSTVRAR